MDDKCCGNCKHFIGGGDWNLCCDLQYDLCYDWTPACDQYSYSEEKSRQLEERERVLNEYIQQLRSAKGK